MHKTSYDAERFATEWIAKHFNADFNVFEEAFTFAVNKMSKTRYEAERFAMDRINKLSQGVA